MPSTIRLSVEKRTSLLQFVAGFFMQIWLLIKKKTYFCDDIM